jgi:hypothetical protein
LLRLAAGVLDNGHTLATEDLIPNGGQRVEAERIERCPVGCSLGNGHEGQVELLLRAGQEERVWVEGERDHPEELPVQSDLVIELDDARRSGGRRAEDVIVGHQQSGGDE